MPKRSEREIHFSFPTREEMLAAQRACCGRACGQCESPAAYAWRRRDVDMAFLLREAIANELTDREREVVEWYWFEGRPLSEIARKNDLSPATVHRALRRAMDRLYRVLRYAVLYQHNLEAADTLVPLALRRALALQAAREQVPADPAGRLLQLRLAENLTLPQAALAVGIPERVLAALEQGRREPSFRELTALAAFYQTTIDSIVKGDNHERPTELRGQPA